MRPAPGMELCVSSVVGIALSGLDGKRPESDPLLVISDRAVGIIKAVETLLPAIRASALPRPPLQEPRPQDARRSMAGVQGPGHRCLPSPFPCHRARTRHGWVADYETELPTATACFVDDFEACIAHLRMPITHRRAIRTTNLLERLFVEKRRRLTVIPNVFGERPILKLMFGAMVRAGPSTGGHSKSLNWSVTRCAPSEKTRSGIPSPQRLPSEAPAPLPAASLCTARTGTRLGARGFPPPPRFLSASTAAPRPVTISASSSCGDTSPRQKATAPRGSSDPRGPRTAFDTLNAGTTGTGWQASLRGAR